MIILIVLSLIFDFSLAGPSSACQATGEQYLIADNTQCDIFHVCDQDGNRSEFLCDDGLVFDPKLLRCALPFTTSCEGRDRLQNPRPAGACRRMNGKWAVPETCDQYVECTDGVSKTISCRNHLVYDDKTGDCEHPDTADRPGCTAESLYNFECPRGVRHGRFPAATDCRAFFTCGVATKYHPRLGGCPLGTVFDPAKQVCGEPKNVPGCENYYE